MKKGEEILPKISVIMSTYKEPLNWVRAAVESILRQSLTDFEFIVVIDDPNNKSVVEYLEAIDDSRVILVKNESNLGLVRSLNKALKLCKADYIARMDADDISLPERFENQLTFLTTHNYDLCGSQYELFDDTHSIRVSKPPQFSPTCKKVLCYESCVAHPTWMTRKIVYDFLDGYRNMDAVEDYDFLIRAAKSGYKLGNVQKVLFKYRDNRNSISHKKNIIQELDRRFIGENYRKGSVVTQNEFDTYRNSEIYMKHIHELEEVQKLQNQIIEEKNLLKKIVSVSRLCKYKMYVTRKIERQFVKAIKKMEVIHCEGNINRV